MLLVVRPPRRGIALAERAARGRRLAAGALAGAGLAVIVQAAGLPAAALAHDRAVDVGLSTQSWGEWAADVQVRGDRGGARRGGAAVFLWVIGRFPRRWWIGAAGVVGRDHRSCSCWLAPVVLGPLFNDYDKLPPGRARTDVVELARRAGIDVGEVYVVDASRRTTAANAYVTGIGHTKRVVLYDTLLERFTPAQTRLVVAHELGHVKHDDLRRGILWVVLAAPAGHVRGAAPDRALEPPGRCARRAPPAIAAGAGAGDRAGLVRRHGDLEPALPARGGFGRCVLARHAGQPRQFIGLERRLAITNVSDPSRRLGALGVRHPPDDDASGSGWGSRTRGARRAASRGAAGSAGAAGAVPPRATCARVSVRKGSCGSGSCCVGSRAARARAVSGSFAAGELSSRGRLGFVLPPAASTPRPRSSSSGDFGSSCSGAFVLQLSTSIRSIGSRRLS